jgi:hypothetical protein
LKQKVKHFKNLELALKELQPFIVDGNHLLTGRPLKRFGMLRSREILANWLICVATGPNRLDFTSDPHGGDGVIVDTYSGETWDTEHIIVPRGESEKDIETRICEAVKKKQARGGKAYASGKTLVVFLNAGGSRWFPTKTAMLLPSGLIFEAVWVVSLQTVLNGAYTYSVVRLDLSQGHPPIWTVHINASFDSWRVE